MSRRARYWLSDGSEVLLIALVVSVVLDLFREFRR